jgi:hypothetical protein
VAPWRRHWALQRLLEPWPSLEGDDPPKLEVLADLLERAGVGFELAAAGPSRDYEEAVVHGRIPTRDGSWHDAFNVLAFVLYPNSKAALHARCRSLAIGRDRTPPRSREEDALTLIDEVSLVVAGSSEGVAAFEQARPGKSLGVGQGGRGSPRDDMDKIVAQLDAIVREHGLFVDVLGHGLLEHLMLARPEVGAGIVSVVLSGAVTRARVDEVLARRIAAGGFPKPGLSPTLPWPNSCVDAWMARI